MFCITRIVRSLLVLWVFLSAPQYTFSAEHIVMPLAFNLNVEKRDIISETITITNTGAQQVRLYATVNEVATDGAGVVRSFVEPSAVDGTNSPTSWIEISRARIELKPGEKRDIPFTIRMNPNTAPGEYSVFLGFASGSNQPEATAQVMAGKAPGTLVNLTVDTKQNQFLRLERFSIDRFITGQGEQEAVYTIANPGAVDVVPKGELIFYNTKGHEVATTPLNTEGVSIARDASADFSVSVPDTLSIGKYKAFLSVEYGEHLTDTIQDTTYFYVAPLRQLMILLGILFFVVTAVAVFVYRRYGYDDEDVHGAESVAMYIRPGRSVDVHHDIDLSKPPTTPSV